MHLIECASAVGDDQIESSVDVKFPFILKVWKDEALRERSVGVVVIVSLPLAKERVDGLISSTKLVPDLRFIHLIEDLS
jgi:hypothetical protein